MDDLPWHAIAREGLPRARYVRQERHPGGGVIDLHKKTMHTCTFCLDRTLEDHQAHGRIVCAMESLYEKVHSRGTLSKSIYRYRYISRWISRDWIQVMMSLERKSKAQMTYSRLLSKTDFERTNHSNWYDTHTYGSVLLWHIYPLLYLSLYHSI